MLYCSERTWGRAAIAALLLLSHDAAHLVSHESGRHLATSFAKIPLTFEKNLGQFDGRVRFAARGGGAAIFIAPGKASFTLALPLSSPERARKMGARRPADPAQPRKNVAFSMQILGASLGAEVIGLERLEGMVNYFIGNDPSRWRTHVPTYARVKVAQVYPGVDLLYYGNQGQFEYDFAVAPGIDPGVIRIAFEGVDRLRVNEVGDLVMQIEGREVLQRRPRVYEETGGDRRMLTASYALLASDTVTVHVEGRRRNATLVIDPVLAYATYLGGSAMDQANAIAVDSSGNAYVAGVTDSASFPVEQPIQAGFGGDLQNGESLPGDVFVAKIRPDGSGLVYSTYLGGSGNDVAHAIALGSDGSVYVGGQTSSTDFPTVNSFQAVNSSGFLAKLRADGTGLVYSTYLKDAFVYGVAADDAGSLYATGFAGSNLFPVTSGAFQATLRGGRDAFVIKLTPDGRNAVYSTFLGGAQDDEALSLAVDPAGSAYIAGQAGVDFPMANAFQPAAHPVGSEGFVAKLRPDGGGLVYSTFLGGSGDEVANAVAVDRLGSAYVVGYTTSSNFPVANAFQATYGGDFADAFLTKLKPDGSGLVYSTYLGGGSQGGFGDDAALGVAVDSTGSAYVVGKTQSTDFPVLHAVQGTKPQGFYVGFLMKVKSDGSGLVYSTFLGGSVQDYAYAVAVGGVGDAYVAGYTSSSDFPTVHALQSTNAGSGDAFVAKISTAPIVSSLSPASGPATFGTQVEIHGLNFEPGATVTFGGSAAADVNVASETSLTALAPARAAGTVDVVVTNPDAGSGVLTAGFVYVSPPIVTGIGPTASAAGGGISVMLSGSHFRGGATVDFGGARATIVTVASDGTSITVTAPPHTPGQVDVVVTNPDRQVGALPSAFAYYALNAPAPAITGVSPSHGTYGGGTVVTLSGTGFQSGAIVSFGTVAANSVTVVSASTLTATTPAHAPGPVPVVVSNPDSQAGSLGAAFTYDASTAPPPTVTAISNPGGLMNGGYTLTITGTGFQSGATITLGEVAATDVVVVSASTIVFTAPAHTEGAVDLVVTNPDGQSFTLPAAFNYVARASGCAHGSAGTSWATLALLPLLAVGVRRRRVPPANR
jgi:hypothetical protein